MATALRPDSRRVAETTPMAVTAVFLFEAAVFAAARTTGGGGARADAPSAATSIGDGDGNGDTDADGVSAAVSMRKKRQRLDPSTAALSHSLALAAGKVRRKLGEATKSKGDTIHCHRFTSRLLTSFFHPLPLEFPKPSSRAPLARRSLEGPPTHSAAAAGKSSEQQKEGETTLRLGRSRGRSGGGGEGEQQQR
jgi:hypothetical protein